MRRSETRAKKREASCVDEGFEVGKYAAICFVIDLVRMSWVIEVVAM